MPDRLPPARDFGAAAETLSTAGHIARLADQEPMSTAVVDGPLQVTYRELAGDLARCVHWLERAGVRPDALAAVEIFRNRYTHLLLLLGCEILGVPTTPLMSGTPIEIDPVLSQCRLLLRREQTEAVGIGKTVIIPDDLLDQLRAMPLPARHRASLQTPMLADRIVRIVRTSGTTAWPKAIALTHAMLDEIVATAMDRVVPDVLASCRFLCIYNFGLRGVYTKVHGVLRHGGSLILSTEEVVPAFLASGLVNYIILTTGDAERIAQRCGEPSDGIGPQVDLIGAKAGERLRTLIRQRIGQRIFVRYATNETSIVSDTDDQGVEVLVPGASVRIVDAADVDLPQGETGLILVRTRAMASGYYQDPALTRSAFVDGWFRTNDVGRIPEPGRLIVLGRADDMLNIGGVKIPPGPLEEAIKRIPGVSDAALVRAGGAADVGDLLVAIECVGGAAIAEMDRAVRAIVSAYVRTFHLLRLPSFPRTESGKVRRAEIEAAFRRRLA